ncbi:MAG: hypothetical protein JNL57_13175 [Bacteroidetes bacterium]|nr:hypothetical protein [Bacteroidota bacterium]
MPVNEQINQSENAYSLIGLAAGADFSLAQQLALGYRDNTAEPGMHYVYKIYAAETMDTAFVYVENTINNRITGLPKLMGEITDPFVRLHWVLPTSSKVLGYILYKKSGAEQDDKAIHKGLLIPDTGMAEFSFSDTIPAEGGRYTYRLCAVDFFGDTSLQSDTMAIIFPAALPETPEELTLLPAGKNLYCVKWSNRPAVSHPDWIWKLEHADTMGAAFMQTYTFSLQDFNSFCLPDTLLPDGYYRISVSNTSGLKKTSLPYLLQKPDSIPPAPPLGLTGTCNRNGVVVLHWSPGADKDLYACRVYRAMSRNAEAVPVSTYVTDTVFTDTVATGMIRDSLYYSLRAFDRRYNPSAFSDLHAIPLPDTMPPPAPAFVHLRSGDSGTLLQWKNPLSADLKNIRIWRADENQALHLLVSLGAGVNHWLDSFPVAGTSAEYFLQACDRNGNISGFSQGIMVNNPLADFVPRVNDIHWQVDTTLNTLQINWNYPFDGQVRFYRIYLLGGGASKTVLQSLEPCPSGVQHWNGPYKGVLPGDVFIRAVWKDGRESR